MEVAATFSYEDELKFMKLFEKGFSSRQCSVGNCIPPKYIAEVHECWHALDHFWGYVACNNTDINLFVIHFRVLFGLKADRYYLHQGLWIVSLPLLEVSTLTKTPKTSIWWNCRDTRKAQLANVYYNYINYIPLINIMDYLKCLIFTMLNMKTGRAATL